MDEAGRRRQMPDFPSTSHVAVIVATCAACEKRTHIGAALLQHGRPPYVRLLDLDQKLR
jgi:hypothetical protein